MLHNTADNALRIMSLVCPWQTEQQWDEHESHAWGLSQFDLPPDVNPSSIQAAPSMVHYMSVCGLVSDRQLQKAAELLARHMHNVIDLHYTPFGAKSRFNHNSITPLISFFQHISLRAAKLQTLTVCFHDGHGSSSLAEAGADDYIRLYEGMFGALRSCSSLHSINADQVFCCEFLAFARCITQCPTITGLTIQADDASLMATPMHVIDEVVASEWNDEGRHHMPPALKHGWFEELVTGLPQCAHLQTLVLHHFRMQEVSAEQCHQLVNAFAVMPALRRLVFGSVSDIMLPKLQAYLLSPSCQLTTFCGMKRDEAWCRPPTSEQWTHFQQSVRQQTQINVLDHCGFQLHSIVAITSSGSTSTASDVTNTGDEVAVRDAAETEQWAEFRRKFMRPS